jgi:hypothetical protein
MSRYHPVRPKKHDPAPQLKPEAAPQPPMPTEAQMEQAALKQLEKATELMYKELHGEYLDAAIRRCTRLLEIYDREQDELAKAETVSGHRWTVSPAIMLRTQRELTALLERRDHLKQQARQEAREIVAHWMHEQTAAMATARKDSSLCPPKQTGPATQADPKPATSQGAPPRAVPDALKPAA